MAPKVGQEYDAAARQADWGRRRRRRPTSTRLSCPEEKEQVCAAGAGAGGRAHAGGEQADAEGRAQKISSPSSDSSLDAGELTGSTFVDWGEMARLHLQLVNKTMAMVAMVMSGWAATGRRKTPCTTISGLCHTSSKNGKQYDILAANAINNSHTFLKCEVLRNCLDR